MSCSSRLMKIGTNIFRVNLFDSKINVVEFEKTGLPDIDNLLMALMSDSKVRSAINEYQESIANKEIYAKVDINHKPTCYTVQVTITSLENNKPVTSKNYCVTVDKRTNGIVQINEMNMGEFMEVVNELFPNLITMSPAVLQERSGVKYLNESYLQVVSLINEGYHEHIKFKLEEFPETSQE